MEKSILVIDDEPDVRRVLEIRLSAKGYKVFTAETGSEGFSLALKLIPNLILLDYKLPDQTGDEVCKKIKANESLKHIPVILITASEARGALKTLKEMHADDFLLKPFIAEDLYKKIELHLFPLVVDGQDIMK